MISINKRNALCKKGIALSNMLFLISMQLIIASCSKIIEIKEPINTITTNEVFNTTANANSAIIGIYSDMSYAGGRLSFANGAITIAAGQSADELNANNTNYTYYNTNTLLSTDATVFNYFWSPLYSSIYKVNAAIEGIQGSTSLLKATKDELTGEAKFLRAFSYFYLTNIFGDVPLLTTTDWATNRMLKRTSVAEIYKQVVADLIDAQNLLRNDYSISGGERTRANKLVATAFLARVYLYMGDWKNAEIQASAVIENSAIYNLATDLNTAFLMNNQEAIWQLQLVDKSPYATKEGNQFIPSDSNSSTNASLTSQLLSVFEPGDLRRNAWVDSTHYLGVYYYYPFKYKVRQGSAGNITEYYTLLRLAEQYLIRAEARAKQNINLSGAVDDLNVIRKRAGLTNLSIGLSQAQILAAISQERRIELFCEWGHRWFDLKRTGMANQTLAAIKPQWKSTAVLYPIPQSELIADPNLEQNDGY